MGNIASPIVEPRQWQDDGTNRREPVIDDMDGRIIRWVGYRACARCGHRFFSRWLAGIRRCDACKGYTLPIGRRRSHA